MIKNGIQPKKLGPLECDYLIVKIDDVDRLLKMVPPTPQFPLSSKYEPIPDRDIEYTLCIPELVYCKLHNKTYGCLDGQIEDLPDYVISISNDLIARTSEVSKRMNEHFNFDLMYSGLYPIAERLEVHSLILDGEIFGFSEDSLTAPLIEKGNCIIFQPSPIKHESGITIKDVEMIMKKLGDIGAIDGHYSEHHMLTGILPSLGISNTPDILPSGVPEKFRKKYRSDPNRIRIVWYYIPESQ